MHNRGFTAMLPTQDKEKEPIYEYKLGFTLFKREFILRFKVNKKE